jgi:hypothetical protein
MEKKTEKEKGKVSKIWGRQDPKLHSASHTKETWVGNTETNRSNN